MKVFISSTYRDLIEHRRAVTDALLRIKLQPIAMEFFSAGPEEPKQVCADEIQDCDLFIGIYAHRYGFIPEGDEKSITEQELDLARELDKPCFCYVVDEDHPWAPKMIEDEPGKSKLAIFKARLDKVLARDTFTTPDHLARLVSADLGQWLHKHAGVVPVPDQEQVDRTYERLRNLLAPAYSLLSRLEKEWRVILDEDSQYLPEEYQADLPYREEIQDIVRIFEENLHLVDGELLESFNDLHEWVMHRQLPAKRENRYDFVMNALMQGESLDNEPYYDFSHKLELAFLHARRITQLGGDES